MCDFDNSTTISDLENQYSIFSANPFTNNSSYAQAEGEGRGNGKGVDAHEELMGIIKRKGKRGFGTSSQRFIEGKEEMPGPGTYQRRSANVVERAHSRHGFGIGKREMYREIMDGGRVPYYSVNLDPEYTNNYLTRPKHMFQYKDKPLRELKIKSEANMTPGPGHYSIMNKTTGPTYTNLFKSNISQM